MCVLREFENIAYELFYATTTRITLYRTQQAIIYLFCNDFVISEGVFRNVQQLRPEEVHVDRAQLCRGVYSSGRLPELHAGPVHDAWLPEEDVLRQQGPL